MKIINFRKSFRIFLNIIISENTIYLICEFIFKILGRRKKIDISKINLNQILIIRTGNTIGDIVCLTPLIRELKKNFPSADITFIASKKVINLLQLCPYIDKLLAFDINDCSKKIFILAKSFVFSLLYLFKKKFDLVVLPYLSTYKDNRYLAYFSGAIMRIGIEGKINELSNINCKLFNYVLYTNEPIHEVERNMLLLKFLKCKINSKELELWLDKDDYQFSELVIKKNAIDFKKDKLICLAVGSRSESNRWPIDKFLEIIIFLFHNYFDVKVLLLGDTKEIMLGKYLEKNVDEKNLSRIINLIGKTTIRQAAALLKCCRFYIGNDTGLMHIAAAMKVPIIEISSWPKSGNKFNSKSPYRFAPWGVEHIILNPEKPISPCKDSCIANEPHCITQITSEEVKSVVKQIFLNLNN